MGDHEEQTLHLGYNYVRKNLVVSDYPTACNVSLLEKLNITHIVACGFDHPPDTVLSHNYGKTLEYFFLSDLLDLPLANILQFLPKVVTFIRDALPKFNADSTCGVQDFAPIENNKETRRSKVLVHCAYGQSRSCAVCVAFLMKLKWDIIVNRSYSEAKVDDTDLDSQQLLRDCYDDVMQARRCLAINPGFMRQLEIYRRMLTNQSNIVAKSEPISSPRDIPFSSAHAYFRAARINSEIITGSKNLSQLFPDPKGLRLSGFQINEKTFRCRKCRTELFVKSNILEFIDTTKIENLPVSKFCRLSAKRKSIVAGSLFALNYKHCDDPYLIQNDPAKLVIEPMDWMCKSIATSKLHGKVSCPNCNIKLGSYQSKHGDFCFTVDIISSKVE